MSISPKQVKRASRQRRIRARVVGSAERPRLMVFRSNKHISLQVVDDAKHVTLVSLADTDMTKSKTKPFEQSQGKGVEKAKELGKALAKKAKEAKITTVVFDRRGYAYHGIVKAVAQGCREGGLEF
ncbi:MAG: 50S ribosomal protein L18 [Candidatus Wildermuthbacteria bacterium]|nr:50S ribosomal protein L18 [Candidatus Wildermuthbacteria bacterium]